jgi:hypothetical protein
MLLTIVVVGIHTVVMPVHAINTHGVLELQLSSFLKFTADRVNWSALSSSRFNPQQRAPCIRLSGDWWAPQPFRLI